MKSLGPGLFALAAFAFIAEQAEANQSDFVPVAKIAAPAQAPGGAGWQQELPVDVPQGQNLIFTYTCPDDAKVPVGNSFNPNAAGRSGLQLVASFRRLSATNQWQWEFRWAKGAPAGTHFSFNIYCAAR